MLTKHAPFWNKHLRKTLVNFSRNKSSYYCFGDWFPSEANVPVREALWLCNVFPAWYCFILTSRPTPMKSENNDLSVVKIFVFKRSCIFVLFLTCFSKVDLVQDSEILYRWDYLGLFLIQKQKMPRSFQKILCDKFRYF